MNFKETSISGSRLQQIVFTVQALTLIAMFFAPLAAEAGGWSSTSTTTTSTSTDDSDEHGSELPSGTCDLTDQPYNYSCCFGHIIDRNSACCDVSSGDTGCPSNMQCCRNTGSFAQCGEDCFTEPPNDDTCPSGTTSCHNSGTGQTYCCAAGSECFAGQCSVPDCPQGQNRCTDGSGTFFSCCDNGQTCDASTGQCEGSPSGCRPGTSMCGTICYNPNVEGCCNNRLYDLDRDECCSNGEVKIKGNCPDTSTPTPTPTPPPSDDDDEEHGDGGSVCDCVAGPEDGIPGAPQCLPTNSQMLEDAGSDKYDPDCEWPEGAGGCTNGSYGCAWFYQE